MRYLADYRFLSLKYPLGPWQPGLWLSGYFAAGGLKSTELLGADAPYGNLSLVVGLCCKMLTV